MPRCPDSASEGVFGKALARAADDTVTGCSLPLFTSPSTEGTDMTATSI